MALDLHSFGCYDPELVCLALSHVEYGLKSSDGSGRVESEFLSGSKNSFKKHRLTSPSFQLHQIQPADSEIRGFIQKFLRLDGVLVLRLIDSNAGYVHMADILHELWKNYGTHHIQEFQLGGFFKRVWKIWEL